MTYNVCGVTLNLALSITIIDQLLNLFMDFFCHTPRICNFIFC